MYIIILHHIPSITVFHLFSCPGVDAELFGVKVNSDPFAEADSKPDPFGTDPLVRPQVNGRESASPEMFDLSRLAPPLSAPPTRVCRTPEAFLGPTGASLVNLDALIPSNPPSKMHKNPFLSGNTQPFVNFQKHYRVIIQKFSTHICLLRSECSVSHQPLPLRPASPHPQPNATILYIPAAPAHALLQPVAATPSVPPATHPPLLSHATSCRTPRPSLQPPAALAPPFSATGAPHSVTDT